MTNQIAVFNFQSNTVRTITDEKGELWFLGNDVCNILGYANPRRTIDLHCKTGGVTKRYTPTESGEQEMTYINEPNLYRLIVKSRKTEAEKFEEWVMEEVLPTIRKTGSYYMKISETQRKTLADAVRSRCGYEKSHYSKVWKAVKDFFQVEVYPDIPASGFNQALQIIKTVELPTMIETAQAPKQELLPNEAVSKAIDHIALLNRTIIELGGTLPKIDLDSDQLAVAYAQRLLMGKRMTISFDEGGKPSLRLIPQQSWIVTEENIQNIVADPEGIKKSLLPNIIVSATNRLYPTN